MNTPANPATLTALRILFSTEKSSELMDQIESIYQNELETARANTLSQATAMIENQLKTLPIGTFGIDLNDVDLASLARGFMPDGITLD